MSGHNKWSKIKHKKAASDASKSKIYAKLVRSIQTESRLCGGDTSSPSLRAAIEKARDMNMPSENIERAIKKGLGNESVSMERITYESYGPGGAAILIEVLTDNRNRAAAEIKHLLIKNGLALAAPGAASWAFKKKANDWETVSFVEIDEANKERLGQIIELIEENDDVQDVFTNIKDL